MQGRKNLAKKIKQVNGFVMNKTTGHVSYAFKQQKAQVKSLGFTHNSKDRAEKKKLSHNVDPRDTRDCYVKTKVENQKYNTYRNKPDYKSYRIHHKDKSVIDYIIANDNKKRR